MGLKISHDTWTGSYQSFNEWRRAVARLARLRGINWSAVTHDNLVGDWDRTPEEPLLVLMAHSECDGQIRREQAEPLAERLETTLEMPGPLFLELPEGWNLESFTQTTRRFIDGLKLAAARDEDLEFQ